MMRRPGMRLRGPSRSPDPSLGLNRRRATVTSRVPEASMARAMGIERVYRIDSLDALQRDFASAVAQPGHVFTVLEVEPVGKKLEEPPMDGPEMKYRFGRYIERMTGVRIFDGSLF